jgi:hypothetical protein
MASEAVQHAAAELEQLLLTDDAQPSANPSPPKTILSLPRELRDQIYGYLLRHEHVHEKPYHTRKKSARGKVSNPRLSLLTGQS